MMMKEPSEWLKNFSILTFYFPFFLIYFSALIHSFVLLKCVVTLFVWSENYPSPIQKNKKRNLKNKHFFSLKTRGNILKCLMSFEGSSLAIIKKWNKSWFSNSLQTFWKAFSPPCFFYYFFIFLILFIKSSVL